MPDEVELSGGDAAPVVLGEAWPRWWRWTSSVEVAVGGSVEVEGSGEALPVAAAAELAGWGGGTKGRRRTEGAGARETEREERSERARGGNFA